MALFLSERERTDFNRIRKTDPGSSLFWSLVNRVNRRAETPGLTDAATTVPWWHCTAEYLSDAAMVHAIKPSDTLGVWLRSRTLEIVRRPASDWIGPPFRDQKASPSIGHLETAHITWGLALVLDLAPDLFDDAETEEIRQALKVKGVEPCQRWLEKTNYLNNWRCVLNAGIAVAAAVMDDKDALDAATEGFKRDVANVFQADGSYSESLQYGNYTAYCLMLTREALTRQCPESEPSLPLTPYAKKVRWDAAALFYNKPLDGWGPTPRPRSANFNDSAAMYRASGDLLLHIASRAKEAYPDEAGLARWLFDTLYLPIFEQGPHDQASFGFINDFGFLSVPLLAQACEAITPEQANVPLSAHFSCGDVLVRDDWASNGGRTVLAIHGTDEGLHAPGHLHGDLNSFILVHNQERLLVDPGHSCYRGLIHEVEVATRTHNTCTFHDGDRLIEQSRQLRRAYDPATKTVGPIVTRGGKKLALERDGDVTVVAFEVAALYGDPIEQFTRFWFQCGTHALFVVDRIVSSRPVKTTWNWLLNNRDDGLDLKVVPPDRLVARRGQAGMKLFHLGSNQIQGPIAAFVHDAYHPLPNQKGEGSSNSGQLIRWSEQNAATERTVMHAITLDSYGQVAGWHLRTDESGTSLESPGATINWKLSGSPEEGGFTLRETITERSYTISKQNENWQMIRQS